MEKSKRRNLNCARTVDVDAWRERQVSKRLRMRLEQRELDFVREHGEDTDAELLAYVSSKARELKRMPHPFELAGGEYLQTRLGDWQSLAAALGYLPASRKKGTAFLQRMKKKEEEAFLEERRTQRAKKKLEKTHRDQEKNRVQAERQRAQQTSLKG